MEEVIYDNKRTKVIVQKGVNTHIVSVPGRPQGTLIHRDQMRRVGSDISNKDNKPKDGLQNQIMNDKIPSCPRSPVQKSNTHGKDPRVSQRVIGEDDGDNVGEADDTGNVVRRSSRVSKPVRRFMYE